MSQYVRTTYQLSLRERNSRGQHQPRQGARGGGYAPAPRIELAMLAIEFSIPPPTACFAIISSRSTSEHSGVVSTPMGMSRLLLTAEASSSPTRRGIDCSLWRPPFRMPCSKLVCATASSSRSSESSSNSSKIVSADSLSTLATSTPQRQARNSLGKQNNKYEVRTCFPALQSGPERRCYHLDMLLEANGLIRLAPPVRVLQSRRLLLVFIAVDGKQDAFRGRGGQCEVFARADEKRSAVLVDAAVSAATAAWHGSSC